MTYFIPHVKSEKDVFSSEIQLCLTRQAGKTVFPTGCIRPLENIKVGNLRDKTRKSKSTFIKWAYLCINGFLCRD